MQYVHFSVWAKKAVLNKMFYYNNAASWTAWKRWLMNTLCLSDCRLPALTYLTGGRMLMGTLALVSGRVCVCVCVPFILTFLTLQPTVEHVAFLPPFLGRMIRVDTIQKGINNTAGGVWKPLQSVSLSLWDSPHIPASHSRDLQPVPRAPSGPRVSSAWKVRNLRTIRVKPEPWLMSNGFIVMFRFTAGGGQQTRSCLTQRRRWRSMRSRFNPCVHLIFCKHTLTCWKDTYLLT